MYLQMLLAGVAAHAEGEAVECVKDWPAHALHERDPWCQLQQDVMISHCIASGSWTYCPRECWLPQYDVQCLLPGQQMSSYSLEPGQT